MAELPEEPNPSEGLLASWGRRLIAALRSMRLRVGPGLEIRQDSEGTTILLANPPPDPNRERPFRARFMRKSGSGANVETALYVYLPPETAEAVRWKGSVVPPAAAQDLGTTENPWVEFEGGKVYIEITLARQTGTGMSGELEPTEWRLAASASAASDTKWYHLVAAVEEDVGLVQYHLGSLLLGFGADLPCPDEYSVEEQSGTGVPECLAKRYVFHHRRFAKNSAGQCQERTGTGGSTSTNIDVPKPPEYSLSVSGTACRKTLQLLRTPCGGTAAGAGETLTFDVPPEITIAADGSTTDSEGRVKAGTVTLTPCGGTPVVLHIWNGKDGAPGASGQPPSGTFLTGISSFGISGNNLTITFNTVTYPGGTTGTVSKSVACTSC